MLVRPVRSLATALLLLPLAPALPAQTAPAATPAPASSATPATETLVLSPFEVNATEERGYIATRSLTATGIGTELGEIPVNLTVLTDSLLLDRSVQSISEAVRSVSGVTANNRLINTIQIRGFESITQRDGATQNGGAGPVDDVQQIEVLKGASSIFHGIVRPGGVVNIVTYSPQFRPATTVSAAGGTDGYQKFLLRTTGPLYGDKVAYLFTASTFHEDSGVMQYRFKEYDFINAKLLFRPLPNLSLKLTYDDYDYITHPGMEIVVSHPAFMAAAARGEVPAGQTAQAWVAANLGYAVPPAPAIVSAQIFPYELFDARGPDSRHNFGQETGRADLFWEFNSDIALRAIAQRSNIENRDAWPNMFRWPAGGVYLNHRASDALTKQEVDDFEAELSVRFDLGPTKHKLLLGSSLTKAEGRSVTLLGIPVNYNPRTDGPRHIAGEINAANPNGFRGLFDNRALWSLDRTASVYASDQIALFDERLRLLGGVRYTERESGRTTKLKVSDTTPQVGALYDINDRLSVFANYGETFEPNFAIDAVTGQTAPTSSGKGYEGGVKFAVNDRHFLTASVYKAEYLQASRDFAREAALLKTPIFFPGGEVLETSGFELDATSNPTDQLSFVAGYSYTWEAETTAALAEPRQVGVRLLNVPEHKLNLWGKYTFTDGTLKGLQLGAGVDYRSEIRIHQSWEQSVTDGDLWLVNLLARYVLQRHKGEYSLSLNVQNALDEDRYLDGSLSWGEGMRASLTLEARF